MFGIGTYSLLIPSLICMPSETNAKMLDAADSPSMVVRLTMKILHEHTYGGFGRRGAFYEKAPLTQLR
jgi:hypothetical protein